MNTITIKDDNGRVMGFQIENIYVSPKTVARILEGIEGVSGVRKRRLFGPWEEIHVWFHFRGVECIVWEPFGDNSLYWIGQRETPEPVDFSVVEQAFRDYVPPIHRKLIGDIVTLHFVRKLFERKPSPEKSPATPQDI